MKSQYPQDNLKENTYYIDQLNRLSKHDYNYFMTVKFTSTNENTNFLNINKESIPFIIKFLQDEYKKLSK